MKILFVLAGESPSSSLFRASMEEADLSIGIDGGIDVFLANSVIPDVHIGDLDSSQAISYASLESIRVIDQEKTDLQKAIGYVMQHHNPTKITILGATGGRIDHLANNLQICSSIDHGIEISLKNDQLTGPKFDLETIIRLTPHSTPNIPAVTGSTLSIIHVSSFEGLHTEGLKWDIQDENSSTGFLSQSNLVLSHSPLITVNSGCVYVTVYQ